MISGGATLNLSPTALADRIDVIRKTKAGVEAAAEVLRDRWEAVLQTGSAPRRRSGRLAGSIRVTPVSALNPTVRVGTPVFYGRILHFGVPGRLAAMPHGDIALNAAEQDMNAAFRKATR